MNKRRVLEILSSKNKEKIKKLEMSLTGVRETMKDAPGTQNTNPDNTRINLQEKANYLKDQIRYVKGCLTSLQTLSIINNKTVSPGSLVTTKNCGNNEYEIYLLIPRGGGCLIPIDNQLVTCISIETPKAQAILNAKQGKIINFQGNTYEIVSIQ